MKIEIELLQEAKKFPRYMMATVAHHKMGNLSRNEPDLCWVEKDDGKNYIGMWAVGFGFVNVKFPKNSTRKLTAEEIERWECRHLVVA